MFVYNLYIISPVISSGRARIPRGAFFFVGAQGMRQNTCQALQCPEDHNMTTLVPMANYRYYSMYSTFVPPGNDRDLTRPVNPVVNPVNGQRFP